MFNKMIAFFLGVILMALSLVGCGNPCDKPENANDPACQTQDTGDTGEPEGWATIQATVLLPDGTEAPNASVSVERGPAALVEEGQSGDELTVPAPASYRVLVGDRSETDQAGLLPLYTDAEGYRYVRPAFETDVEDGSAVITPLTLNPYYQGYEVECDLYTDDEFRKTKAVENLETKEGYKLTLDFMDHTTFVWDNGQVDWNGNLPDNGGILEYFSTTDYGFEFSYSDEDRIHTNRYECRL